MRKEGKLHGWTLALWREPCIPRRWFIDPPPLDAFSCRVGNVGSKNTWYNYKGLASNKSRKITTLLNGHHGSRDLPRNKSHGKRNGERNKGQPRRDAEAEMASGAADAADQGAWLPERADPEDAMESPQEGPAQARAAAATLGAFLPPGLLARRMSENDEEELASWAWQEEWSDGFCVVTQWGGALAAGDENCRRLVGGRGFAEEEPDGGDDERSADIDDAAEDWVFVLPGSPLGRSS